VYYHRCHYKPPSMKLGIPSHPHNIHRLPSHLNQHISLSAIVHFTIRSDKILEVRYRDSAIDAVDHGTRSGAALRTQSRSTKLIVSKLSLYNARRLPISTVIRLPSPGNQTSRGTTSSRSPPRAPRHNLLPRLWHELIPIQLDYLTNGHSLLLAR
jgi:hypothetical protein